MIMTTGRITFAIGTGTIFVEPVPVVVIAVDDGVGECPKMRTFVTLTATVRGGAVRTCVRRLIIVGVIPSMEIATIPVLGGRRV